MGRHGITQLSLLHNVHRSTRSSAISFQELAPAAHVQSIIFTLFVKLCVYQCSMKKLLTTYNRQTVN